MIVLFCIAGLYLIVAALVLGAFWWFRCYLPSGFRAWCKVALVSLGWLPLLAYLLWRDEQFWGTP